MRQLNGLQPFFAICRISATRQLFRVQSTAVLTECSIATAKNTSGHLNQSRTVKNHSKPKQNHTKSLSNHQADTASTENSHQKTCYHFPSKVRIDVLVGNARCHKMNIGEHENNETELHTSNSEYAQRRRRIGEPMTACKRRTDVYVLRWPEYQRK